MHENADKPSQDEARAWDSARRQLSNGLLSIIMPAYGLGDRIASNIRHVHSLFEEKIPFEIIPVDDGSDDHTRPEMESVSQELRHVIPVYLETNTGKGAALRAGFRASRGTHILLLDGDLDLPPSQVAGFFDILEKEDADVVIGSKRHPESVLNYPWHRKLLSDIYYLIVKLLVGLPVRDTQTGIKLFKRSVLQWVFPRMLVKRYAFDLEVLSIAHEKGFRVAEAPITMDFQGGIGAARPEAIKRIVTDTLAIFYRIKILKYYQSVRELKETTDFPLISIIVAYPEPSTQLDECLDSISKQKYPNYEVILLPDFPSQPGAFARFGMKEQLEVIPTGKIRPAEKRNMGISAARGEIVAFLDDDAFPTDGWLRRAVAYFSDERVAAVGGPATTPRNDGLLAQLSGRVYASRMVSAGFVYRYIPERVREVEDYPSCNLFVRTCALRELHGFHTEFWPGEDTYLCLEITKTLKKKIIYDPWVHVYHHRRRLFRPHLRQVARYALHRGYFARKFPETSFKLSYFIPSLFVLGVISGIALAPFSSLCRFIFLAVLCLYGFLALVFSFSLRPHIWMLTCTGVVLTHIAYGVRFLIGFLAYRMPSVVAGFDHASESTE